MTVSAVVMRHYESILDHSETAKIAASILYAAVPTMPVCFQNPEKSTLLSAIQDKLRRFTTWVPRPLCYLVDAWADGLPNDESRFFIRSFHVQTMATFCVVYNLFCTVLAALGAIGTIYEDVLPIDGTMNKDLAIFCAVMFELIRLYSFPALLFFLVYFFLALIGVYKNSPIVVAMIVVMNNCCIAFVACVFVIFMSSAVPALFVPFGPATFFMILEMTPLLAYLPIAVLEWYIFERFLEYFIVSDDDKPFNNVAFIA